MPDRRGYGIIVGGGFIFILVARWLVALRLRLLLILRASIHSECIISQNLVVVIIHLKVHLFVSLLSVLCSILHVSRLPIPLFSSASDNLIEVSSGMLLAHVLLRPFEAPALEFCFGNLANIVGLEFEIRVHSAIILVILTPDAVRLFLFCGLIWLDLFLFVFLVLLALLCDLGLFLGRLCWDELLLHRKDGFLVVVGDSMDEVVLNCLPLL